VDRVLNVVAHPDDDLLFLSPDLISSIEGGAQVRTIFVTAGDAGRSATYWQARMRGVQAAYAQLSGVADDWTPMETGLDGATGLSLADAPQIGLVFLKLPDGGTGSGFHRYRFHSLPQLWRGQLNSVIAVDDSAAYSRGGLVDALGRVMRSFAPKVVRTQDFLGRFGDGDHGDHHAVGSLTRAASRAHPGRHRLVAYQDYATQHRAVNVPTRLLAAKRACFATYARSDPEVFARRSPGAGYAPGFDAWLRRQYVLAVE
jgi:LmbE family N-acetylglucosaminyl deacetylase